MNTSGEAADQVMRMMLEGTEVLIKLSGKGAERAFALVYTAFRQQKKTQGAIKLSNMLRSGTPVKVFTFHDRDLTKFKEVAKQADAVMEVKAGTSSAAIIDSLMAAAMVGEGTSYADLTYTVQLNSEEYGVGFRQGSDLVAELNKFFVESYADGSMLKLAEKYGTQASIIEQK